MENELTIEEDEIKLAETLLDDEQAIGRDMQEFGPFFYFSKLPINFAEKEFKAKVELVPEGEWKHPQAPGGSLKVTELLLKDFVKNFVERVVGNELPLDFDHEKDSRDTPGWITELIIEPNSEGGKSIFAMMNVTNSETRAKIKEGSLKYISPEIWINWENPADGKHYNVIRAAGLTNYPFIKNMDPIKILNFSEFAEEFYKEGGATKMAEDPKKEDPKTEDPKTEDPKKEDLKTGDPKTEDPKKEDDPGNVQLAVPKIDFAKATTAELKGVMNGALAELKKRKVPGYGTPSSEDGAPSELTEAAKASFSEKLNKLVETGRITPAQVELLKKNDSVIKLSEGKEGDELIEVLKQNKTQVNLKETTFSDNVSVKVNFMEMTPEQQSKYLLAQAEEISKKTGEDVEHVVHRLAEDLSK